MVEQQQDKEYLEKVPWTIQQTFLGILVTIAPWVILALILSNINGTAPRKTPLTPQLDLVSAIVAFIFALIIEGAFLIAPFYFANHPFRSLAYRSRLALRALGFRSFPLGQTLFWMIVLLLGIFAANFLYQYVITVFHLNLQTNDQVLLAQSKEAPLTTYATLLSAILIAPFCEEIFFRGFVFPGLCNGMPVGWAIVLSALLFAVVHADPGSFVLLFVIGLAFALLRWRTRSIWPGMILHAFNNGIAALVIILTMNGIIRG